MAVVLKPKRGTNTPGTDDIVSGEIAIDTSAKKLYINDGGTVKEIGGGGAGGSTTDVTQSSHGFSAKDCIRHNGSSWVKAQADSASTLALGVVTAVADSNTFTVAQSGRFTISSHGLTVGQWYYLDASTAGALTATEPAISQPLVYVESASVVFVFPYRPTQLLVNGGASVVPADNTVTSAKIVDGTIVTADLADDAITTAKIADDAITSALIADDAIVTAAIADDAITSALIADDAITSALIADDAVVQAAIADEAVDEARLQISNAGSNGQFLSKQSGNTGGLTWADITSGTTWDMTVKTADFTAVAGNGYLLNTTGGGVSITLPSSPSNGDIIEVKDVAGTAATNQIRLLLNGNKFDGQTVTARLHDARISVAILYTGSTYGWVTIGDSGNNTSTVEYGTVAVEFLTLAGGGSGGKGHGGGGGGGAGGYIASTNATLDKGLAYTVTVGAGGAGTSSAVYGGDGGNSSFAGTTATGGGAGSSGGENGTYHDGKDGGSGGGGTYDGGSGTSGQGNDGGNGASPNGGDFNRSGGGGGGAGSAGGNSGGSYNPGAGGSGSASSITGSSVTRAGGGGGSLYGYFGNNTGAAGSGGGGIGGSNNTDGTAGTANTGGGGGASCYQYNPYDANPGTNGGSGTVIIKVLTSLYSGTHTGSPTVTTSGSHTILQFTSSGTYTP